jgi:hypothetical protein
LSQGNAQNNRRLGHEHQNATKADAPIGSSVKFMVDGNPMALPGILRPLCAAEEDASSVDNVPVVD